MKFNEIHVSKGLKDGAQAAGRGKRAFESSRHDAWTQRSKPSRPGRSHVSAMGADSLVGSSLRGMEQLPSRPSRGHEGESE